MGTKRHPTTAWGRLPVAARVLGLAASTVLVLALVLLAAARWLLLDAAPRLSPTATVAAASLAPLQQWLRWNDPRRLPDGAPGTLRATAADLQWLGAQAAQRLGGAAQLQLSDGRLQIVASLPFAGRWANIEMTLGDGPRLPTVQQLQVGRLCLPASLAGPLLTSALRMADPAMAGRPPLHEMLQGVRLRHDELRLAYRWRADLPQRLSTWLLPPAQQERLRLYQAALRQALMADGAVPVARPVGRAPGPPAATALPSLLTPLFELARARSAGGGDAAAENRAALLVLAAHASGRPLASWLPVARSWPALPRRPVMLGGRNDFAVHLLASAALAAEGGGPLADAVGLAKEMGDARQGSGFSFNDIAINRAGTRLGEMAVHDPARLQALLTDPASTAALLPDLTDLPEFLTEAEFRRRFGGVGEPAYLAMTARIEARVAAMPLWH
jgi:hypothetical protein